MSFLTYIHIILRNLTADPGLYCGSKAAMTIIADTLRLELAPFDVKVVTVITGTVQSKILDAGADLKLPPTSRYASVEKEIVIRASGQDGVPRQETSVYAQRVVKDILGGANGHVWRGTMASVMKFVSAWLPGFVLVSFRRGLWALRGVRFVWRT